MPLPGPPRNKAAGLRQQIEGSILHPPGDVLELEALKIFCTVAEEQSVTRAAARLGRVPSNVSTRIQQLEADMKVAFFVRTGKRMLLSTSGERLLGFARRMLALAEETRQVITEGRYGGVLSIGGMESTAASRLPSILATYHSRHPATRLEVRVDTSRQLLDQVRTCQLDCAFLALPPSIRGQVALKQMGLVAKVVWREELLLLLPASESGARRASDIRTRSLAALAPGCAYRDLAEQWLGITSSTDWKVVEMASYHLTAIRVAVEQCVALVPKGVADLLGPLAGSKSLRVGHTDTWLLSRRGHEVPAFQHLLQQLEET